MNHKQDVLLTYRLLCMSEWLPVLQRSLHHFSSSNNNSLDCDSHISWLISLCMFGRALAYTANGSGVCSCSGSDSRDVWEVALCHRSSGFVSTWRCEIYTDFHFTDIVLFFLKKHVISRLEMNHRPAAEFTEYRGRATALWRLLQQKIEQNYYDRGRKYSGLSAHQWWRNQPTHRLCCRWAAGCHVSTTIRRRWAGTLPCNGGWVGGGSGGGGVTASSNLVRKSSIQL